MGWKEEGYERLRPGGIVTDRENFNHWVEKFPEDDVTPGSQISVSADTMEQFIFIMEDIMKIARSKERMRIVLDYDPQAKKMVVTPFYAKGKRDNPLAT